MLSCPVQLVDLCLQSMIAGSVKAFAQVNMYKPAYASRGMFAHERTNLQNTLGDKSPSLKASYLKLGTFHELCHQNALQRLYPVFTGPAYL